MNNDYKKECWKRYLENQKYEKYDKEDLVDEIIELQKENQQLKENYDRIYNENCKLIEERNITDISLLDENQQLKKQKDDVVEYIKFLYIINQNINGKFSDTLWGQEILELLGEIDE